MLNNTLPQYPIDDGFYPLLTFTAPKPLRECDLEALRDPATAERFWAKVDRRGPADCWPWVGGMFGNGYGGFRLSGRMHGAQRIAWALEHGREIPPGLLIRHRCNQPRCVNPAHLKTGTVADNSRDMIESGRSTRGEKNPSAVLSESQVAVARLLAGIGWPIAECARAVDGPYATVRLAVRGHTWPGPVLGAPPVPSTRRSPKPAA